MPRTSYAVALGSNRRTRFGSPAATLRAAAANLEFTSMSRIRATPALGPAGRSFANAVARIDTELDPDALLRRLKALERAFGRRAGRRWGPRPLDLDIILWSEGCYVGRALVIPHPAFRERSFVLHPLAEILPDWRDPVTGRSVRHLAALTRFPRATT